MSSNMIVKVTLFVTVTVVVVVIFIFFSGCYEEYVTVSDI